MLQSIFISMESIEKFLKRKKLQEVQHLVTEKQKLEIEKVVHYYHLFNLNLFNRLDNIKSFIEYGVEDRWLGRIRIIVNKLKNDVLSEYACKVRYGSRWEEKRLLTMSKTKMDKSKFISLYGEEEGIKRWESRNEKTKTYGLENAIKRYGVEEGTKRWEKTLSQKINTMQERKKIKPYKNGRTLSEYQQKYGIEEGYKRWFKNGEKLSKYYSIEGFIERYGDEEGRKMHQRYCKEKDHTSRKSFIKRYGEIDGNERYEQYVKKIKYVNSLQYYIDRYGEVVGRQKYKELVIKRSSYVFKNGVSEISQKFCWSIYEKMGKPDNFYFSELNKEIVFYTDNPEIHVINVDLKFGNKIVEFDGTYWHSSEKQKKKDKLRDEFLSSKGYQILRIDETDFRQNSEQIINKTINFLNGN